MCGGDYREIMEPNLSADCKLRERAQFQGGSYLHRWDEWLVGYGQLRALYLGDTGRSSPVSRLATVLRALLWCIIYV